ncbi:MAG TPA: glycosyltransferase family 2 protein [Desulfuromonadales bacterium]|nr:glycosyltransferase family 2 protein [Desulfuromonadales bacterium]
MDSSTDLHPLTDKYSLAYVVILNWNGREDTVECVESCLKLSYGCYRILIVDNGSTDGSEEALRKQFPGITIIQTGENLGYAGGNNIGVDHAIREGAEYVWLLNNDTVVDPDALTMLVAAAEANRDAGILGSKIYYYGRENLLWFAGGWIRYEDGCSGHYGENTHDEGQFDELRDVDYITGCSLMITRRAVMETGLMDPRYFLLFEETDWNERVKAKGMRVLYVPGSKVWHKISQSLGERSPLYNYYLYRNCMLFTVKHRPVFFFSVLRHKIKSILQINRNGDKEVARGSAKGMVDFFLLRFGKKK